MMDVNKAIDDVLAKRDQSWETFARAANKHGYRTGFIAGLVVGVLIAALLWILYVLGGR